jgi:putative methionine-R-sulfoxide reductase with GAF domain
MPNDPSWNQRLASILTEFNCQTGTIHRTQPDGKTLELVTFIGIPEFLLEKISIIPFGKGIAGAAAEQRKPVELCNLQQDLGGVAKPDARQTMVSGSLAVPILDPNSQSVIGTLGVGMVSPHNFTPEETQNLEHHAATIAAIFQKNPQ